jgi:excisionase family DNA binding protein
MATAKRDLTNPPVQGHRTKQGLAPQLLTVEDAAIRLSVSTKSIRRWIETGQLPAVRLGRAVRVEESAVADFIDGRRIETESYFPPNRLAARRAARAQMGGKS